METLHTARHRHRLTFLERPIDDGDLPRSDDDERWGNRLYTDAAASVLRFNMRWMITKHWRRPIYHAVDGYTGRPRNHICCGLVFIDDCSTADSCDATQNEDSKNIYSAKRIQITCNYKVFIDGIKCNWNAIEMHEWFPVRRLKIISNKRRFWIQLLLRLLLCLEQWTYTKNYIMLYRYLLYIIAQRI